MIALQIFIIICLGLSIKFYPLIGIPSVLIYLGYIFYRHGKKAFFVALGISAFSVAIPFIEFDIKKNEYVGIVIETKDNYFILNDGLERYYVNEYDNEFELGDILRIKGKKEKLEFDRLESEFDFKDYLNKKGVKYSLINTNILPIIRNPLKLHKWRKEFLNRFDDDSKALIGAILFSDNSYSSDIKDLASNLHLTRLISASGIYIMFFINILNKLLSYRLKEKKARLVSISILMPYLIFTFPRFTVIRILFIYLFRWINDYLFKYKLHYLNIISISGIFFLLLDYRLVYQDSFLLGFMIPITMYFLVNDFNHVNKVLKKVFPLTGLFILFIPYEIKYFNEVAPLYPLYQIILSPLFIVLAVLGVISFLHIPIYGIVNHYVTFIGWVLNLCNKVNPLIYVSPFNEYIFYFYYVFYYLYLFIYETGLIPWKRFLIVLFSISLSVYASPIIYYFKEEISFINVGQGDCTLIRKGETAIMIDTGGNIKKDIAKNVLIPYLKKKQIYDLDLVITTHDDYDHMGAFDSLNKHFKVRNYINEADDFPIKIGNITINNYNYHQSDDKNTESLVISFHLANLDFVITGDAPIMIEKEIMANYSNIPCDILKVGHHGSNTSTSEQFVQYLSPIEAVISCGKNNSYGHPHQSVIEILRRNNVVIRRTDIEGTITYSTFCSIF